MSAIADMRWGPIEPHTPASGLWFPAFAGTPSDLLARRSASARLPAAAHAGAARGRARAGTIRLGFALRAHLVEIRLARRLALRAFSALAAGALREGSLG